MLKERSRRILSMLVETFVSTGEPVGSRTLSKAGLGVSPATIRNEMADLEEAGYLAQPHTSAGRIPTDKAYRFWLDQQDLSEFHSLEDDQRMLRALDEHYLTECRGLEDLLSNTCRILSQVCAVAGVASPRALTDVETRIQLVGLDRNHVMAVLVAESGLASSHILSVPHSMSQEELNKISRVFNEDASRSSVRELLSHRVERLRVLEEQGRDLARRILGKLEEALMQAESEVFYDGLSRVFQSPDPAGEQHLELTRSFASGEFLAPLLKGTGESTLVRVGSESGLAGMEDFALVAAGYDSSSGGGTIGILGPKRMDYRRVIGVVNDMKRRLEEILA